MMVRTFIKKFKAWNSKKKGPLGWLTWVAPCYAWQRRLDSAFGRRQVENLFKSRMLLENADALDWIFGNAGRCCQWCVVQSAADRPKELRKALRKLYKDVKTNG